MKVAYNINSWFHSFAPKVERSILLLFPQIGRSVLLLFQAVNVKKLTEKKKIYEKYLYEDIILDSLVQVAHAIWCMPLQKVNVYLAL